jgi:hypothetical protein
MLNITLRCQSHVNYTSAPPQETTRVCLPLCLQVGNIPRGKFVPVYISDTHLRVTNTALSSDIFHVVVDLSSMRVWMWLYGAAPHL